MIPFWLVRLIAAVVRPLGLQVMSLVTIGSKGADRIFIQRPGTRRELTMGDDGRLLVGRPVKPPILDGRA